MPQKVIRFILAVMLFTESFNLSAFAQALEPAYAPNLPAALDITQFTSTGGGAAPSVVMLATQTSMPAEPAPVAKTTVPVVTAPSAPAVAVAPPANNPPPVAAPADILESSFGQEGTVPASSSRAEDTPLKTFEDTPPLAANEPSPGQVQTSASAPQVNEAVWPVSFSAPAQESAAPNVLPIAQNDEIFFEPVPSQQKPQEQGEERFPFEEKESRASFKLFEPSRYEFVQDDTPMMLPAAQDPAEEEFDNYYRYSRKYLENVIGNMDGGIELQERGLEYLEILNPSLMLPIFGTTISLTGRKTFGINYNTRKYKGKTTVSDKSYSNFEFEQEMQIKLQGKISDRIFVDIDYDDQREDAQNISVSYRGKEGEFVQSADFGDIEISLPQTEFLSYSKQVFGAKMHLQHKGANLRLIGSQTKGETRSKQFKGDSVFETVNIRDVGYIRRRYYDLTFGGDPSWTFAISPNTEKVYLDDHTNEGYQEAMWVQDLHNPSSRYPETGGNGAFKLLTRGVDYVMDYNRNMIIFNTALSDTDVVAIDFQNTQGQWLSNAPGGTAGIAKIIKTSSDRPISSSTAEIGYKLEVKRFYDIGTKQITIDNGQGNFILKLVESDGRDACAADSTDQCCIFNMDYDKGIFEIMGQLPDSGVYATTPTSATNRYFFVQFSSTVRTYFLESDIVVQSETVKINGATMARNRDYYIDYASGFLTFYNDGLISANSTIDVTYETSAMGGSSENALLGARFNYDFTKNITVGASILHEAGSEPKRVPNVGALTSSLTAMEADFKAKDVEVVDGVKVSLGGEVAQSKKDENLFGYAMVDNLEETKEFVKASTSYTDWKIASNPNGKTAFFDSIKWDSQEVPVLEVNPNGAARADNKQVVLTIDYDFTIPESREISPGVSYLDNGHDEVSIVFPISNQGADFTKKTLLELSVQGEAGGPLMDITFGTVDERSDNYNTIPAGFTEGDLFPTCSKYFTSGSFFVPKTEDLRCTGLLTSSEDIGWLFVNPDGTYNRYNPFLNNKYNRAPQPNGLVDTQDLNSNGIYDSEDFSSGGHFGYMGTEIIPNSSLNFTGWKQFQKEFDFSDSLRWGAVRQMRITLKKDPLGNSKGTIKISNLSVSGSTWQTLEENDDGSLIPYGINNIDNGSVYKPIFNDTGDGGRIFRELYGSVEAMRSDDGTNNIKEQSLAMQYDFSKTIEDDIFVQRTFSTMDFSQHREFQFLLYNNNTFASTSTSFYLRIATDDNNYSEIEIPMDFINEWRLYKLKMIDTNDDGIPERWENVSNYPATVVNMGYLNFKRIGLVRSGLRTTDGAGASETGEIWLDEIFLGDSVVSAGSAYMAEGKVDIENWMEFGGKYTYMDDKFQTPVAVPSNQKNTQQDYYLKFKRIKNLPVTATYSRANTVTPDALGHDSSNTVSVLDQGEVDRKSGTVKAEYLNANLPRINIEYAFDSTDYSELERSDDRKRYSASLDYTPKSPNPVVKSITAGAALTKSKIDYSDTTSKSAPGTYYNTDETMQNYNFKMSLQPWTGASIVPSYSLSTADEKRRTYDSVYDLYREKKYSKSANQNVGISTAFRINKWLAPTASYSVNIKENNNLSPLTYRASDANYNFDIGEVKSISRTSDGTISLSLNGKEMFPKSKLFSGFTLSGSYKLQDGDAWQNVDDSFTSLDELWLRSSMGLNSPYTYRSTLTLRDTYSATLRWAPFREYSLDGRLAPVKSLSIMNSYSQSFQTNEDMGSRYDTETTTLPDLVLIIDEVEKFFVNSNKYFNGANIKLKYKLAETDVVGANLKEDVMYGADLRFVLLNYFDTNFSYTYQTMDKTDTRVSAMLEDYVRKDFTAQTSFNISKVRFTPKFTYLYDTRSQSNNILVNDVEEIVPSLNVRADFNLPFSVKLPFITRQYLVTNRVVWNSNLSYSRRRSFTVAENRDLFDFNTNFDYEISKNIRLTLTGGVQLFKHLYIEEDSYTAYNIGTVVTIQF